MPINGWEHIRTYQKDRNYEIARKHFKIGMSYRKIGEEYGLQRERVRQIVERVQRLEFGRASRLHRELGEDAFIQELNRINDEIGLHPRFQVWLCEHRERF